MDIYDDLEDYEIIPVCPERFMGIPRPKISLTNTEGKLQVIREDGLDVSEALEQEIEMLIASFPRLDKIILKAKSPSCGFKTTPVNHDGQTLMQNGLLVHKLLEIYDESIFFDETNYNTTKE